MFVYIVNPKESKRKELLELVVNLASWSYFRPNFGKIWSELLQFFSCCILNYILNNFILPSNSLKILKILSVWVISVSLTSVYWFFVPLYLLLNPSSESYISDFFFSLHFRISPEYFISSPIFSSFLIDL